MLDIRETVDAGGKYPYALQYFNVYARIAKHSELPPRRSKNIRYKLWRIFGSNITFIKERGQRINHNILSAGPNCYLEGYFQSEGYFSDISQHLRNELKFISSPNQHNVKLLDQLADVNAVSLHVRRGDYMSPRWSSYFAKCEKEYYDAAISYVTNNMKSPVIIIFSDEPEWVKCNMRFNYPVIISKDNPDHLCYEDLRLMSVCKHNIIANSTFSWWGAWLNTNPNKIIVAPRTWFAHEQNDDSDIVPNNWVRIAN